MQQHDYNTSICKVYAIQNLILFLNFKIILITHDEITTTSINGF